MPRKKKIVSEQPKLKWYVMFGFDKDDIDHVAYWKAPNGITEFQNEATIFPSQNVDNQKGFGTPSQWLKLVNEDEDLNKNFQFHLVSVIPEKFTK